MKALLSVVIVVSVFFGAFAGIAGAAEPAPFTKSEFNRFMSDWPAYVKWAKKQGEKYKNPGMLEGMRFSREVVSHFNGMGWKPERFFYVAAQSARGLASVEFSSSSSKMSKQMAKSRRAIKSNPNLTAQQKKKMLASMAQSEKAMAGLMSAEGLAPQEMALIKANRKKLKRVFKMR